ncbi:4-amino-4-deoxychorismate lyase [Reichenbachiella agariperforans]|uniref:4-amino-4-deoxychorismate lyase n=1 Tax=Reichenbachiella agariperforans TaxID=156994 RepID=A0A1M6KL14_REIAG|nr:aminotransferase class IV [Reichenbachiella agariperforans]SHJ59531.1 4-amino-4-deoxychorismate lyase [Reichenbachiella agariperforans]
MSQFIESINYQGGKPELLDLHQQRVNRTFAHFYPQAHIHDLGKLLPEIPDCNQHKCRVLYDESEVYVEFIVYHRPTIQSLRLVEGDEIDYTYKYVDRSALSTLFEKRGEADDIIIVKDGMLTDSYFANLAFYDGNRWLTPETPLLSGIRRTQLINEKILHPTKISVSDLRRFQKVSLINAMNDLSKLEINVDGIISN